MSAVHETLTKIEGLLGSLVGSSSMQKMDLVGVCNYAHAQMRKAACEEVSTPRLKALQATIQTFKANYEGNESVTVPVYVEPTTSLDEQSNEGKTLAQVTPASADGKSVFDAGFVAKVQEMSVALAKMASESPSAPVEEPAPPPAEPASAGGVEPGDTTPVAKSDDAAWPDDLNDPKFAEGQVWGKDGAK
jgi:hypothetical protein